MTVPMDQIGGYRMEWKPGEYVYMSPEDFEKKRTAGARVWILHTQPHAGCNPAIEVYRGATWVQPKHVHGKFMGAHVPLYLGPMLKDWEPIE